MNAKIKKTRLTKADKDILIKNSDICTDLHGRGCAIASSDSHKNNLN